MKSAIRIVSICLSFLFLFRVLIWANEVHQTQHRYTNTIDNYTKPEPSMVTDVLGGGQFGFGSDTPPLVWYAGIGCDSSGFFNEIAALLSGLHPLLPRDKLRVKIGKCSDQFLSTLIPQEARVLADLQKANLMETGIIWQDSVVVQHKLPGQPFSPLFSRGSVTRPLYLIGRVMTESIAVPKSEVLFLETVDEIWVPTSFHADVYVRHGVKAEKLFVVPPAVDVQFFAAATRLGVRIPPIHPESPVAITEPSSSFRLVSVFKWEHRKAPELLLDAYWRAFSLSTHPTVELVLRSYKPHWEPGPADIDMRISELAIELTGLPRNELPPVVWLRDEMSKQDLRSLYQTSQVFVLPTRGEGFCLPCVEAMAAGLPIIVTNFSGPSDYLQESHSYPLKYAPQLNMDGSVEPDISHLSNLMQAAHSNPALNAAKGSAARKHATAHYSLNVVASTVCRRLMSIHQTIRVGKEKDM